MLNSDICNAVAHFSNSQPIFTVDLSLQAIVIKNLHNYSGKCVILQVDLVIF